MSPFDIPAILFYSAYDLESTFIDRGNSKNDISNENEEVSSASPFKVSPEHLGKKAGAKTPASPFFLLWSKYYFIQTYQPTSPGGVSPPMIIIKITVANNSSLFE